MNNRQQNGRRGRGRNNNGMRPMGGQNSGNRIDSRARGNAAQLHEKYKNLARDTQMQGDRVMTEYYLQFADHYFRVLAETRGRFEEQRPRRDDEFDGDEGDMDGGFDEAAQDRPSERAERREPREYRDGRDPSQGRDGQTRDGRTYDGQARDGQSQGGQGGDGRTPRQPRFERRDRDEGMREERNGQREPREAAQRDTVQRDSGEREPPAFLAEAVPPRAEEQPAEPRRRGRPRKDRVEAAETAPTAATDADRLPPTLLPELNGGDDQPAPAPRVRRTRKPRGDEAGAVTVDA